MNRRTFIISAAAAASLAPLTNLVAATASEESSSANVKVRRPRTTPKGFMLAMLNSDTSRALSLRQKFQLLRDAGFAGVEPSSAMDQREVLAARDATGLQIPSVVIATHWVKPLSDPNPATRQIGLDGLKQGLRDAKVYGASSVLLVPATVTKEVSYLDAYTRSIAEIQKALPLAEELGVVIAIENVWNQFLLSPREAVEFVDAFKSPFVRWHFDVGNVVTYGWPEHWIRALGSRIVKIHVKEYSRKLRDAHGPFAGFKIDLLEGDNDWPSTMASLDAVGYDGWFIAEQWRPDGLSDVEYLTRLSEKMDTILNS
jgi:L-ribulose-5-phosphate 3-epimerase